MNVHLPVRIYCTNKHIQRLCCLLPEVGSKVLWSATNLYLRSELVHSNTIYESTPGQHIVESASLV